MYALHIHGWKQDERTRKNHPVHRLYTHTLSSTAHLCCACKSLLLLYWTGAVPARRAVVSVNARVYANYCFRETNVTRPNRNRRAAEMSRTRTGRRRVRTGYAGVSGVNATFSTGIHHSRIRLSWHRDHSVYIHHAYD